MRKRKAIGKNTTHCIYIMREKRERFPVILGKIVKQRI
jgi:hypothetical protein